jgi:hypothetical protein
VTGVIGLSLFDFRGTRRLVQRFLTLAPLALQLGFDASLELAAASIDGHGECQLLLCGFFRMTSG